MLRLCLAVATSMLVASAAGTARGADVLPAAPLPNIQQCVVELLRVDGIPVVRHGWCYWDEEDALWVPMSTDIAHRRVFGIRPIED